MYRFYRRRSVLPQDLARAQAAAGPSTVVAEHCFYVQTASPLDEAHEKILRWLLAETFDPDGLATTSFLAGSALILEIGPRINFETAWSSTARTICHVNGLDNIIRLERSRRFGFGAPLSDERLARVAEPLHDRMTETIYPAPLTSFDTGLAPDPVLTIGLAQGGITELRRVNRELGLAMDEADLDRFGRLFTEQLRRDPTDVELFQLAQGNSEHCRHGFFTGRMIIDGEVQPGSLMSIVKEPWRRNPGNSLIAFGDDSSAIRGQAITAFTPAHPGRPSPLKQHRRIYHPTLTAETHNHPSGVAPYPGAATGTGGRIRDNQVVGRGGLVQVSGTAYCVGNLHLTDEHVWEADGRTAPAGLAAPLDILIQASNGASDYGNCFGEPLIYGFVRTFGAQTPGGYRSWFKPVMYSTGAGQLDDAHVGKQPAEPGLLVVQLGGPAYRIGLGGGAASSMMSGENEASLDFNSVQRGDPELEQRLNRVLRACIDLGDENPIVSAHDLGAGGDCNALPEIVYPAGARIDLRAIPVGDASLSVLEIWGNESQERNAILVRAADLARLTSIAAREKTPLAVVGEVTGDGQLSLHDSADGSTPVDLPLEPVLGKVAPKDLELQTVPETLVPLSLDGITLDETLERVLRLPSVASKSYLTRKVDRCVTGHVAQQQCVGPNQLPLSDYAVYGQSLFGVSGVALSLGEQPVKGLVDPAAMARMAVAEALLNLVGAKITQLPDIRCSANWMWAAKLPGEGAKLRRAALAMSELMIALGIAVDGGKDSLSMAVTGTGAEASSTGPVKAPGQLVISAYAPMPDVRVKVTPDLKTPGNALILVDLSGGQARLGGSALAQVWQQLGDQTPDVDDATILRKSFCQIQDLVAAGQVAAAHDRSDGGLITTVLEMAFAGNTGLELDLGGAQDPLATLFAEELGVVLETGDADGTLNALAAANVPAIVIGRVGSPGGAIVVRAGGQVVIDRPMTGLREVWEDTSTRIDRLQADPESVDEEYRATKDLVTAPDWRLTYAPSAPAARPASRPRVAVLRDQGSNGDRELAAAFHAAGFEAWDVTMTDLLDGRISLDHFRGIAFPGGFSYGDVLDAGKAWAGIIKFHGDLADAFDAFYRRPDTFSLGLCNGAQLMALLGWVPDLALPDERRPRFIRNRSGRFECRLATVEVAPSPSIFLRGMAGSRLGVWVAHGEGRLHLPDGAIDPALVPLRYADPEGKPTEIYPFNPNGSPGGATALTSPDGRHLAMMPHPERMANQLWQWPWLPPDWRDLPASPWLRMFQNVYDWCVPLNTEKTFD
ncbi:MAG TPA: phosphoribosylformylglycinamidine synthase [Streptosporangiaceae bacterium]|nr:phosphoribosylformylglycinamidine synthase [Streptosporangiaceae bacterium]